LYGLFLPPKLSIKDMYYISYFLLLSGLFFNTIIYSQTVPPRNNKNSEFQSPLDIPLLLSANYGEYRSGHFHAGIDFKTQQVEGKNVFAADSGYIYRVVVLAGSYGNAVYLKHPSGKITLYGHLSRFEPAVEKYVKEQQYRKKSFTVDLSPDPARFVYRKGGFLGWSGNSGGSFGAHLHFEVRDQSGAIPLNPLNYNFAVKDNIKPQIRWLMLYPLDTASAVNGIVMNLPVKVNAGRSGYYISPDTIKVKGKIGLGIETYDFLNDASNECGPSTIEVSLDKKIMFFCRFDSIPFSSGSYINSHFDYGEMFRSGRKIQKLYIDPNNKLNIYKIALNRGIIHFNDPGVHNLRILVTDTYGNESELNFMMQWEPDKPAVKPAPEPFVVSRFSYDSLNIFENQNIRVMVPKDALFDHVDFKYQEIQNDSILYSSIHQVHHKYTPLLSSYILSIKPRDLPVELHDKALIASRGAKGTWISQGGEYKNGFVTTRVKAFGEYIIAIDTTAPVIKPLAFTPRAKYTAQQVISFLISDDFSGIRKYSGYIDDRWVLFEYDAKNNLLMYKVDPTRLTKGISHDIVIRVTDNKGNSAQYKSDFYY
jgi:hypothetical protein